MKNFLGTLALQQRVLPTYRAPFFALLAKSCGGGMELFAGLPRPEESIAVTNELTKAHYTPAQNIHILSGAYYFCYQRGLMKWLKEADPSGLIVEANPRYLSTPSAIRWMHRRNRPVIGWGLGAPSIQGAFSNLQQASRKRFINQFDALISYSQRGADEYAALGFNREKIFVAPNAVTPRPANPLPDHVDKFVGNRATILFVGRIQARKRVENLLRVCASLVEEIQPRLIIVGDGPERAKLEFLGGVIYPLAQFVGAKFGIETAEYFKQADLFVLPGTGGLAVQEAMSYALPIIVAQGDGTQDDLVRPQNGWQIPPNDDAALKSALETALKDPALLRKMGAESYRIVAEEINLEKMADVFVDALNSFM